MTAMKKIAVFGKPGSGKSTLSQSLSSSTGIPWHALDSIAYTRNGELRERKDFDAAHQQIMTSSSWIIDGLGPLGTFFERLHAADTLIYIDLPYVQSYWLVTKRMLQGMRVNPAGWPEGSSIVKGTLRSYQMLRRSPSFWNQEFLQKLETIAQGQSLHIIRSTAQLQRFVAQHG